MTTVVNATIDPTDRSIPPATITIVMPSAAVQTMAVCLAISSRLLPRKNCGPTGMKTIATSARPRSGPPESMIVRAFTYASPAPVASSISECSVSSSRDAGARGVPGT